jgi:NADPH-dependent glutamate synthase beta subunit-like oxidoreductase
MVKDGRYMDALKLIKQDNPFPAVCGAVCNKRCEDRCTRGTIDQPVAIDEIKKFIAAQELKEENRYIPNCYNDVGEQWDDYKIAVIGSGPAGLTCAGDLAKLGYDVTIFEALHKAGGVLEYGIPEFRLPKDAVLKREINEVKALGVKIETDVIIGRTVTIDSLMDEEGLRQTEENPEISIAEPIKMDDEWVAAKLVKLDEAAKAEVSNIRELVAEIVPTYKPIN